MHKLVVQKDVKAVTNICKSIKHFRKIIPINISQELVDLFENTMISEELIKKYSIKRFPQVKECPEVKAFIHLLHLFNLLNAGKMTEALPFIKNLIFNIKSTHRATFYYLNSQAYYYLARVAEMNKCLATVKNELYEGYTNAKVRNDVISLATITNCLLRYYVLANQYELANQLIVKGVFPETASNNQYARYLYYEGKISAIQLAYSEAHTKLLLAYRKSPQKTAKGFRICVQKMLNLVELLMGEIPERTIFSLADFRMPLRPYYQICLLYTSPSPRDS